jgi:hypothetical protein
MIPGTGAMRHQVSSKQMFPLNMHLSERCKFSYNAVTITQCDPQTGDCPGSNKLQRRIAFSGMLHRVALVRTDLLEELSASIIRVTTIDELGTSLAVTSSRRTDC